MPDYVYLLENRLSHDQRNALQHVREAAREAGMILFLTGDAVRDLTSGHAVRELEIAVHGSALKMKKIIERLGGKVWGEDEATQSLYLCFPGTVRVDVLTTHRVEYPKPGKPVYHPASIQEDLRRRDFSVNAMAISLNEGSFGLLMDPLNGAADIEARTLRLVSSYGFLEDPSLLIRATRYRERLGWELDSRTQTRYENAKNEGVIEYLSAHARSRELEQIGHEEEGLKVLGALEAEGWMQILFPAWSLAKADEERLTALHDLAVELLMQGVHADTSAAQMQLLTARMAPKDLASLKKLMLRPGFVEEWNSLDALAAAFAKVLLAKENQSPSASYKLFTSYDPEAVLWLGFTSKSAAVRERFNQFLKVWPEARQKIPHALMQEMRITPELATYNEIVHDLFLELIDGRLTTPEEMRAFMEPHSPPAPPPPVTVKRSRAKRGAEAKLKEKTYEDDEDGESEDEDVDLDDLGGDEDMDIDLELPRGALSADLSHEGELHDDEEEAEEEDAPVVARPAPRKVAVAKAEKPAAAKPVPEAAKPAHAQPTVVAQKPVPAAPPAKESKAATHPEVAKAAPKPPAKAPAKAPVHAPVKTAPKPAVKKVEPKAPAKNAPVKAPVKAIKAPVKPAVKLAPGKGKPAAKAVVKVTKPAHGTSAKAAVKKPAPKPGKKR